MRQKKLEKTVIIGKIGMSGIDLYNCEKVHTVTHALAGGQQLCC